MKKKVLQVVSVLCLVFVLCLTAIQKPQSYIQIVDEEVPLNGTIGMLISEQEEDVCEIPDKYNTGAHGELTAVTSACYISGVKFGTTGATDRKLDLFYQSVEVPDTIVVENYDFSASDFKFYNGDKMEKEVTVIYRNCKFQSYLIRSSGPVKHVFENCTFTHFAGSDATFLNCYFGGGTDGDGINPVENCTFTNCMIADLIHPAEVAGENHVDGFQIFGSSDGTNNTNITLENCRFEVPAIPYTTPSGAMNCPLSVIMRYSDAENITFSNCYVNGGLYYALMLYDNGNSISNLTLQNIRIGESSKSPYTCDTEYEDMVKANVSLTNKLYVASVRKLEDGIHLSVTNDTATDRKLCVVTAAGMTEFDVPACPRVINVTADSMDYADFPFDMDIVVPEAEWVICYDITETAEQIRFVNWTGGAVYADVAELFKEKETVEKIPVVENEIVADTNISLESAPKQEEVAVEEAVSETVNETVMNYTGLCGDNIAYSFENGILTLSGTGTTYNYHSGSTAPWYAFKEEIKEVIVGEGVVCVGNQLFAECTNLNRVILPEGLTVIGSNVFKKCNNINYIFIPQTMISVGDRSFSTVGAVEYGGTAEEWSKIDFGNYNEALSGAAVSCVEIESMVNSGMCGDNVAWSFSSEGILTLSGSGATYNYHSGNTAPWYSYAADVKGIVIEEGITEIGNFIFRDCSSVTNIVLPGSVVSVGTNSFSRCKGLTILTCSASLTNIGKNAFAATNISTVYYNGTAEEWSAVFATVLPDAGVIYQ